MSDRIRLILMVDYHTFPVWFVDKCVGAGAVPDELGLSASLAGDLQAWSDEYTDAMYRASDLDWPRAATLDASWNERGRALLARLRGELAGDYVAGYFDVDTGRVEWPDESDTGPSMTP